MRIQKLGLLGALTVTSMVLLSSIASAQNINDVRWKTEVQVRALLGAPNSVSSPTGTHATYTLWQYDNITVAFANSKAFHMFHKNSLSRLDLNEKRSN